MKYPFRRFHRRNAFQIFLNFANAPSVKKIHVLQRQRCFPFYYYFKTNHHVDGLVRRRHAGSIFIIITIPIVFIIISVVIVRFSVFIIIRRYKFARLRECQPRIFRVVYGLFILFHIFVNVFENLIDISEFFCLIHCRVF